MGCLITNCTVLGSRLFLFNNTLIYMDLIEGDKH